VDRVRHHISKADAPVTAAPVVAAPASAAAAPDVYEQLRKLAELRDQGVINPEDFEAKKQELMRRI
jgi:hypothetical protein